MGVGYCCVYPALGHHAVQRCPFERQMHGCGESGVYRRRCSIASPTAARARIRSHQEWGRACVQLRAEAHVQKKLLVMASSPALAAGRTGKICSSVISGSLPWPHVYALLAYSWLGSTKKQRSDDTQSPSKGHCPLHKRTGVSGGSRRLGTPSAATVCKQDVFR